PPVGTSARIGKCPPPGADVVFVPSVAYSTVSKSCPPWGNTLMPSNPASCSLSSSATVVLCPRTLPAKSRKTASDLNPWTDCEDNCTTVPSANEPEQLVPQSIPGGAEATRPDPVPFRATVSVCGGSFTNVAHTVMSAATCVTHAPGPPQAPLQVSNRQPDAGVAESVTFVPSANAAEQAMPQSIPAGDETTLPAPF